MESVLTTSIKSLRKSDVGHMVQKPSWKGISGIAYKRLKSSVCLHSQADRPPQALFLIKDTMSEDPI